MKLTRRGRAASFAAVSLAAASAVYQDFLIEIALLCLLAVVVPEAVWVKVATRKPGSKIRLVREESEPGTGGKAILYPGDESAERVRLIKKIGGKVEFESSVPFLRIDPRVVHGAVRDSTLEFRFRTHCKSRKSPRRLTR